MITPKPPRECQCIIDERMVMYIERSAYEQTCKERDELKIMIERINTHIFPGEIDSIDSLRLLIKERDEARAEIEQLRVQLAGCGVAALCNTEKSMREQSIQKGTYGWSQSYQDVMNAVKREIGLRDLLAECEKALGRIVGQVEKWTDEHGITRITECDSSIIAREALTKLKASKGGV